MKRTRLLVTVVGVAVAAVFASVIVALAVSGGGESKPPVAVLQPSPASASATALPTGAPTAPAPAGVPTGSSATPAPTPASETPAVVSGGVGTAVPATVVAVGTATTGGPGSTPPPPSGPCQPQAGRVTSADNNGTYHMHVGDAFLLCLGNSLNWTVNVADTSVLSRVVNIAVIEGAQGVYRANAVGETKLTAVGDPACRSARPPCMMPSMLFSLTVVVGP